MRVCKYVYHIAYQQLSLRCTAAVVVVINKIKL